MFFIAACQDGLLSGPEGQVRPCPCICCVLLFPYDWVMS